MFSELDAAVEREAAIYFDPDRPGRFSVRAATDDPESGIQHVTFPALGTGWRGDGNFGTPYETTYAFEVGAADPGPKSVRATNGAGLTSAPTLLIVRADGTPPISEISCDGSFCWSGTYTEPVEVSLDATDGGAGVAAIRYRIGGGDWQPYSTPFTADASTSVEFYAVDRLGNTEPIATQDLDVVPATPPPDPATTAPPLDLSTSTSLYDQTLFLYTGTGAVQTGVVLGTIKKEKVALLRGKALGGDSRALSLVEVSVRDHPEFGLTRTRADGMFDLVVNAGGSMTLDFEKVGFLASQRPVNPVPQQTIFLEDVALTRLDARVTEVDLEAAGMHVARGTEVSDEDGERQATLLFPDGVNAAMELPDGSIQQLPELHVRATEYTVGEGGPERMPGVLPPSSGYTYSVEFSVDEALAEGATDVSFDAPVVNYVENFLDFPVGGIVPTGYYDRELARWIGAPNGRVIEITDEVDGKAVLAGAEGLMPSDDELRRLAELYQPGDQLWRVLIEHFTPWDHNWPYTCETSCDPPAPPPFEPIEPEIEPCTEVGSIIECENQTLGEDVAVAGTPFRLHYGSDRVAGRRQLYRREIPVTGDTVPDGLKRIELEVAFAGRRRHATLDTGPNQSYAIEWDGLDAYGRPIQGAQTVFVRISYVYQAVYSEPGAIAIAFAAVSSSPGASITPDPAREEITVSRELETTIGGFDAAALGFGGWTLDVQNAYEPATGRAHLGNGARRGASTTPSVISRVTGQNNIATSTGDGGPASAATIFYPRSLAYGPDGSLYFASGYYDYNAPAQRGCRIRRIRPDGIIERVAGGTPCGYSGDGGPALDAQLGPQGAIAVGADGAVYIADAVNHRVRKIDPKTGIIRTIAGNGSRVDAAHPRGDGGPATEATVPFPLGIAVAADGTIYVSTAQGPLDNRIRRIAPDGTISTFMGEANLNGTCGYQPGQNGDGGPASAARGCPGDLAVGPDGALYLIDSQGDGGVRTLIRRIGLDGVIETVAGGGVGFTEGEPARDVGFTQGEGLAVGPDSTIYYAQTGPGGVNNIRVIRIGPSGTATTVAGDGQTLFCNNDIRCYGPSGDGGAGKSARFASPRDVAVADDGTLYVADAFYVSTIFFSSVNSIRKIAPAFPRFPIGETLIPTGGGSDLYVFDDSGRQLRTLDSLTGAARYRFAYQDGLVTEIRDIDNNVTTIERAADGSPTAIVAPGGQRTELTVGVDGFLTRIENPAGEGVDLAYTTKGLLTRLTDPRGGEHVFEYDADGRLVRDDPPGPGFKTLTRTGDGNAYTVTVTTALGRTTTHSVERLPDDTVRRRITYPDGRTAQLDLRPDGSQSGTLANGMAFALETTADPRWGLMAPVLSKLTYRSPSGIEEVVRGGRSAVLSGPSPLDVVSLGAFVQRKEGTFNATYAASTRTTRTTMPGGRERRVTLDAKSRAGELRHGNLAPRTYAYDALGRLVGTTHGAGDDARAFALDWDAQNRLVGLTDPLLRGSAYAWDAAERLTEHTRPDSETTSFAYDARGNLTSVTPPDRPAHTFAYSPANLGTAYTPPGGGGTTFAHNADGQLTRISRPGGTQIDFTYDASNGRLTRANSPAGAIDYDYDSLGNVVGVSAPGENVAYEFDGPLLTKTTWSGAVSGEVSRTYRDDFRIASTKVNGAHTVNLVYDVDGLPKQAGGLTISRDQSALVTGTTLGGVTDTRAYNVFGELTSYAASASSAEVFREEHQRDKLGRVMHRTETTGGETHAYDYAYDLAGRLTGVKRDDVAVEAYTYDANGNRTDGGATHDAQDRLIARGSVEYQYAPNGELARKIDTATTAETTYSYDAFGNLRSVELPAGTDVEYVIDGRQRRIGKKVDGIFVQGFLYQDYLAPIAELNGSGEVVSRFVYGTRSNVPDYLTNGGATYRIVSDRLGSVRLVVDVASGAVVQRMSYDAFGRVVDDTNPGFQPFGFAGGLYDPQTKLTRFGTRDYDAETGRWTSKDPIRFGGRQTNLYAYAHNDPVNLIDRDGLEGESESAWSTFYHKYQGWTEGNNTYAGSEGGNLSGPASATTWEGKLFGIQDPNGDTTVLASGSWERPGEKLYFDFRTGYGFCPAGGASGNFAASAGYNRAFGPYGLFDFDAKASVKGDFSGNGRWNAQATVGASEYLRAGISGSGDFSGTVEVAPVLVVGVSF